MNITLNQQQQKFVNEASVSLSQSGWKTLCGYSGTGKTTCLKSLYERYPNVVFLAPTHKAVNVLREKLDDEAYIITTTSFTKGFKGTRLERLNYKITDAEQKNDKSLLKKLRKDVDKLIKSGKAQEPVFGIKERAEDDQLDWVAVICDESSMVDVDTRNQIIENCDSAIFVGDGFQLPPVTRRDQDEEVQDWFGRMTHDWELTQVVRQSENSGILHMASLIRNNPSKRFPINSWMRDNEDNWDDLFCMKESKRCRIQAEEDDTMMLSYTNDVVDQFSYNVRAALGRDPNVVEPKDKLYAANNFGKHYTNKDEVQTRQKFSVKNHIVVADLTNLTTSVESQITVNTARLKTDATTTQKRTMLSSKGLLLRYDYARTIHSSQGSEWDFVMYRHSGTDWLDDLTHNRLIYTAITRAAETFILLT